MNNQEKLFHTHLFVARLGNDSHISVSTPSQTPVQLERINTQSTPNSNALTDRVWSPEIGVKQANVRSLVFLEQVGNAIDRPGVASPDMLNDEWEGNQETLHNARAVLWLLIYELCADCQPVTDQQATWLFEWQKKISAASVHLLHVHELVLSILREEPYFIVQTMPHQYLKSLRTVLVFVLEELREIEYWQPELKALEDQCLASK